MLSVTNKPIMLAECRGAQSQPRVAGKGSKFYMIETWANVIKISSVTYKCFI